MHFPWVTLWRNLDPRIGSLLHVANHASQIDVGAIYAIQRRFKWIAKQTVALLPGVGWIMILGQHVMIQRSGKNKQSVRTLFAKSQAAVESGIPMFIFPQGTRKIAQRLPFKDGAFIIAQTSKAPLVPISIDIPRDAWNSLYPLSLIWTRKRPIVKITVHEPLLVTGEESRESLKKICFDRIYSVLPNVEEDAKTK